VELGEAKNTSATLLARAMFAAQLMTDEGDELGKLGG
jgi:hypothetical protein